MDDIALAVEIQINGKIITYASWQHKIPQQDRKQSEVWQLLRGLKPTQ